MLPSTHIWISIVPWGMFNLQRNNFKLQRNKFWCQQKSKYVFDLINDTFALGALILWCDVYLLWFIQFVMQSVSKVKVIVEYVQGFMKCYFHSSLTHLTSFLIQLILCERRMQCFILRNILMTLFCICHRSHFSGTF